ncbi:MAG: type II toxin-antitoxin system RatA family toxin [Caulobacteraceae bacterium]
MSKHHVERILPFSPEQLWDLVGDVAKYPEFVPWISSMRVGPIRLGAPGVETLDAEAGVGFSFLKERFSTRVKRDANARTIDVDLINGPFKRLLNHWSFEPHPLGTKIVFDIDFEFKSRLLDVLLKANFDHAVNRLISCFETRAEALFTPQAASKSVA